MARFVITVDGEGGRMRTFLGQPGAEHFAIWSGVDLRRADADEVSARVDPHALLGRYGRLLAPGEVGCALSHRALMHHLAGDPDLGDEDVVLVVEDDAVLHPDLEETLPWLVAQRFDVLTLHHGVPEGLASAAGHRERDVMERAYPLSPLATTDPTGRYRAGVTSPESWMLTVGYLVRKRAAATLVREETGPVARVADDYRVMGELGLRVCQVRPGLVSQSDTATSTIDATGRGAGVSVASNEELTRRLEAIGDDTLLRRRKVAWLVSRDVVTRAPWRLLHDRPVAGARRGWNRAFERLPATARHLLRPGRS